MKRLFEKAFTPPFKVDDLCHWVYDSNRNFCFQFMIEITDAQKIAFEQIINNKKKPDFFNTYTYKTNKLSVNGTPIILMRGWGYFTGTGGLKMDDKEAEAIQDDLGNYITEKLNGK